jgi:hypothetical protein
MAAIQNPCDGSGERPTRTRRTPLSLGSRFGGKLLGCCPIEGCEARVTANGRLAKHEVRAGEFARTMAMYAAEGRPRVDDNDPRHLD